jgi:hypothetical protein
MALLHRATMAPTKLELLAAWLPGRSWYTGSGDITRVAAYRFDDPAGAVGIEMVLVGTEDGAIFQVPLTYREAPLPGAEPWLVGTSEHSVLGTRWVYDACGDSVFAPVLASAIAGGIQQAEEYLEVDGERQPIKASMAVTATGGVAPTVSRVESVQDGDPVRILTDAVELMVVRRIDPARPVAGATLTGTWDGQVSPVPLAYAASR